MLTEAGCGQVKKDDSAKCTARKQQVNRGWNAAAGRSAWLVAIYGRAGLIVASDKVVLNLKQFVKGALRL